MTKSTFLILIIIFASLSNIIGVSAANANEKNINNDDNGLCLFSIIICLNDSFQQELEETAADEVSISSIVDQVNSTKIIDQVNSTKLKKWVDSLSSFHTRHTKSEYIEKVAYWLKDELQSICKEAKTYFNNFTQTDQQQGTDYHLKNIVCDKKSSADDDDNNNNLIIIISAHYDSTTQDSNNITARAPGADDNASGVAAVLELARILSSIDLKNSIQFVLFSGEEQGQWGSRNYAKHLYDNNTKIDLLINLDMIGYPPPQGSNKVAIEYDLGNRVLVNDRYSKAVAEFIKHIALEYTNLEAVLAAIGKSDYTPFEAFGYTVIGVHDGGSELNPNCCTYSHRLHF
jgi:Zn-dependent M28 family amino/carboxypeptidase